MELKESIKTVVQGCGVQLYDIVTTKENNNNIFRIYITSPDGITLEKCTEVSRMVSPLLDVTKPINGNYNLEVSSPGIERKLKTIEHFSCSIGENIKIKGYSTETLKGKSIEVNIKDKTFKIQDNDGDIHLINYDDVLSASTYFLWKE